MRLLSSLTAIVMLTVACGGDGSEDLAEKLAAANQEIKEITAAHDALTEANAALESKITELEASVEERDALLELFDEEDGFLELLKEKQSTIDSLIGSVGNLLVSSGPCGVFRLSGSELLKLRWIDDHKDDFNPINKWRGVDGAVWWENTGVHLGHEVDGYSVEPRELWPAMQRAPDKVKAFKVLDDRNHFFHVEWHANIDYRGTKLDREDNNIVDLEGLLGASVYMVSGILGVDENCEWGIVPIDGTKIFPNSGITTRGEGYGDRWFVSFGAKYYDCEGWPDNYPSVSYDAKAHAFVGECPEDE